MRTLLQAFIEHFDNTSEQTVLDNWSKVKEKKYGGPTVEEFFNIMNMLENSDMTSCQFEQNIEYITRTSPEVDSFLFYN